MSKHTVTVNREHANAGDVLVSLDGGEPFHIPGDVTPFTALRMLGPWLEQQLDAGTPDVVEHVTDPETGEVSKLVNNVEVERSPFDPKAARLKKGGKS